MGRNPRMIHQPHQRQNRSCFFYLQCWKKTMTFGFYSILIQSFASASDASISKCLYAFRIPLSRSMQLYLVTPAFSLVDLFSVDSFLSSTIAEINQGSRGERSMLMITFLLTLISYTEGSNCSNHWAFSVISIV